MCFDLIIHRTYCETRQPVILQECPPLFDFDIWHPFHTPGQCQHSVGRNDGLDGEVGPDRNGDCLRHGRCCRVERKLVCDWLCHPGYLLCQGRAKLHLRLDPTRDGDELGRYFFMPSAEQRVQLMDEDVAIGWHDVRTKYFDAGASVASFCREELDPRETGNARGYALQQIMRSAAPFGLRMWHEAASDYREWSWLIYNAHTTPSRPLSHHMAQFPPWLELCKIHGAGRDMPWRSAAEPRVVEEEEQQHQRQHGPDVPEPPGARTLERSPSFRPSSPRLADDHGRAAASPLACTFRAPSETSSSGTEDGDRSESSGGRLYAEIMGTFTSTPPATYNAEEWLRAHADEGWPYASPQFLSSWPELDGSYPASLLTSPEPTVSHESVDDNEQREPVQSDTEGIIWRSAEVPIDLLNQPWSPPEETAELRETRQEWYEAGEAAARRPGSPSRGYPVDPPDRLPQICDRRPVAADDGWEVERISAAHTLESFARQSILRHAASLRPEVAQPVAAPWHQGVRETLPSVPEMFTREERGSPYTVEYYYSPTPRDQPLQMPPPPPLPPSQPLPRGLSTSTLMPPAEIRPGFVPSLEREDTPASEYYGPPTGAAEHSRKRSPPGDDGEMSSPSHKRRP